MIRGIVTSCLILLFLNVFSQVKKGDTYPSFTYDSTYGITLYEKLNFYLGGDSIRYDKKGYSATGWYEDYYGTGTVLHKGYYAEGVLKVYKNFFNDGKVERSFTSEFNKGSMEVFWPNGNKRSEVEYKQGTAVKWTDYYSNGQIEFTEEFNKDDEHIYRKFYYRNGNPQSILELSDPKKKLYSSKEYHENGKLKEEGVLKFVKGMGDFQKEGKWIIYDNTGKPVTEQIYSKGDLSNEKQL